MTTRVTLYWVWQNSHLYKGCVFPFLELASEIYCSQSIILTASPTPPPAAVVAELEDCPSPAAPMKPMCLIGVVSIPIPKES